MTAVAGVATFSGLTLDQANSHEFLYAYAGNLPYVYSDTFAVTAAAGTHPDIPSFSNVASGEAFPLR